MKKINKKQKLIIFIALAIVAVILVLIITTKIVNNNKIINEEYLATTANTKSNLVASYIKEGVTIGGITGTLEILDTSDANALPEDIAWGETAYVKGKKITGTKIITIAHGKASQKTFETNTLLVDEFGNQVIIPAGFKVASDSAVNVNGGVVIEDVSAGNSNTKESQFVWVPVGNVRTDNNGNSVTIVFGRYAFDNVVGKLGQSAEDYANETRLYTSGSTVDYFQELLSTTSSNNAKAKNIKTFITKVIERGGYYIGRYEAGDATATSSARTSSTNDNNPVTCKAGVYPYNYVTQLQASSIAQKMYNNSNIESDLINSYAWDTALVFIQNCSGDTDYSTQGIIQNTFAKCGEAHSGTNYDVRCNIYDIAGNTKEWTTETYGTYAQGEIPCIKRGGAYNDNSTSRTRLADRTLANVDYISFRVILYF